MNASVRIGVCLLVIISSGFTKRNSLDLVLGSTSNEWELIIDKKGIQVFSKWMVTESGLKTRVLKGELHLNGSGEEVVSLIKQQKKWMQGLKDYRLLNENGNEWYSYVEFHLPWPLNNKDLVALNNVEYLSEKNHIRIYSYSCPDFTSKKSGVKRIEHFEAEWNICQISKHQVELSYIAYTANEPEYPRWIQDPIVQSAFFSSLAELKAIAFHSLSK